MVWFYQNSVIRKFDYSTHSLLVIWMPTRCFFLSFFFLSCFKCSKSPMMFFFDCFSKKFSKHRNGIQHSSVRVVYVFLHFMITAIILRVCFFQCEMLKLRWYICFDVRTLFALTHYNSLYLCISFFFYSSFALFRTNCCCCCFFCYALAAYLI